MFKKEEFLEFLHLRILDSSYTKFSNKIGLNVSDEFIKNDSKVVLAFPIKIVS